MDNRNSHKSNLDYKHMIERSSMLTSEVQAWRELMSRHKQAIQEIGLANFVSWAKHEEEMNELGSKLTLIRLAMRNRQQNEMDV